MGHSGSPDRRTFETYISNLRRMLNLPADGVAGGCVARCLNRSEAPSEGMAIG